MASSPPTDGADHIVTRSPPRTSISNEKAGIAVVTETDVSSDAKTGVKVEVSQVCDIPSTSRMQSYMRSFHDLFTVEAFRRYGAVLVKFGKFTGPGTIISVAYIDPDNYQTAVSSGAEFKFKLLFMILVSNLIAIYLQVSTFMMKKLSIRNYAQEAAAADGMIGTSGQAGRGHGLGPGADEPRLSSTLVKYWTLGDGRGSDCLHRYWTSKFPYSLRFGPALR